MFPIGHKLIINNYYVKEVIRKDLSDSTLGALGFLTNQEVEVLQTGAFSKGYFIRVLPKNIENMGFNGGKGIILYFPTEEFLIESFVDITQEDTQETKIIKGFNNTPKKVIPAFYLVKIIIFSKTIDAHIIEPLNLTETFNIIGITEEKILPGLIGKVTQIN